MLVPQEQRSEGRCEGGPLACLLHELKPEEFQAPAFRCVRYSPGQALFNRGDPCHTRVFNVCTRLVGCFWGEGRLGKRCLEIRRPQDWVGSECWSNELWICEGRALTEVSGWWVRKAEWLELVHRWETYQRFLRRQRERLRHLHEWQVVLAHGSVRARVAWWLLRLAEWVGVERANPGDKGIFVPLRLTQEQQAELVGASRPAVSQALKSFQEQGWLVCDRAGYWIRDREALAKQGREGWGEL